MAGETAVALPRPETSESMSSSEPLRPSASSPMSSPNSSGDRAKLESREAEQQKSPQSQSDGSLHQKTHNKDKTGYNNVSSSPGGNSGNGSARPRSLFTSHTGGRGGKEGHGPLNAFPEFGKYSPRASLSRDWIHSHFADPSTASNYDAQYSSSIHPSANHLTRNAAFFDADDDSAYYWNDPYSSENTTAIGATVTSQGIISLRLHSGVQVDTTIDKGIRLLNTQSQIIIALSPDGNSAALVHPSGLVYAYGSRVEVTTMDINGNTKFAKMFYKGVSFTSDTSALVYLVDQAGTRTTSDTFSDLSGDFSVPVFLHNAHYGSHMMRECTKILRQAQYWITEDGTENWVVNGIRVSQTSDGLVRVGRGTSKYQIRTSPTNGTATITTPSVHTTASVGIPSPGNSSGPHLFVKRGERRLHSDGLTFIVRNAGHASGFDEYNQLKVY